MCAISADRAHLLHETCINNDNLYFVGRYVEKEMKTSGTRDDVNIHQSSSLASEKIKIIETGDSQLRAKSSGFHTLNAFMNQFYSHNINELIN